MSLPKTNPKTTNSWKKLAQFAKAPKTLQNYFAEDASRAEQFSIVWNSFFVDYSKNHIDKDIQSALLGLKFFPISKSFSNFSDQVFRRSLSSFKFITPSLINFLA